MRVFNRIIMIVLLAGLFVAGLFGALYSFDLLRYTLSSLSGVVEGAAGGIQSFVGGVEGGGSPLLIAILIAVAVAGLILLLMELKPRTPRKVKMQKGTYVSRSAVKTHAESAAESVSEVLGSTAKVKARRGTGAKVDLEANVRRGDDVKRLQSAVKDRVKERLDERGTPVSSLKVRIAESDPRQSKTRVK